MTLWLHDDASSSAFVHASAPTEIQGLHSMEFPGERTRKKFLIFLLTGVYAGFTIRL